MVAQPDQNRACKQNEKEVRGVGVLRRIVIGLCTSMNELVFCRLQEKMEITGTLKQRKVNLKKEGYSLDNTAGNQIYFIDTKQQTYVPMTSKMQQEIDSGVIRV